MKTIISLLAFSFFSLSVFAQQQLNVINNSSCNVFMKAGWSFNQACTNTGSTGGFAAPAGQTTTVTAPFGARFGGAKGYSVCGPIISPTPFPDMPHKFAVGAPGFCSPCNYGLLPFSSSTIQGSCCQQTLTVAWFNCGTIVIN